MSKFAVIESGGKQYRVEEGQSLCLEKLDSEPGSVVKLSSVLLIGENEKVTIGAPFVEGATVEASVVEQGRHKKVHILKFKRRKHYMKQAGHRQSYTKVLISKIHHKQ